MSLFIKQKHTDFEKEPMVAVVGWEGCKEGIVRDFGINIFIPLYLKWVTNKDLLYSTGNSVQCYMAAWMGGEFGGEWICVYVWLSPFVVHLKLSQYF